MIARDRRALTIGTIVIAVSWTVLRGVPSLVGELVGAEDRITADLDRLYRDEITIQRLPALRDSLAFLEDLAARLPGLGFNVVSEDAATARLIERIREVGGPDSAGHPHQSIQSITPRTSGAIILGEVLIETDLRGVIEFVGRIEEDSVLGMVAVQITALEPHAPPERAERLQVALTIGARFETLGEIEGTASLDPTR